MTELIRNRVFKRVLWAAVVALFALATIHGWAAAFDRFYVVRGLLLASLGLLTLHYLLLKKWLFLLFPILVLLLGWAPPTGLFAYYWYRHQEPEYEAAQDRALDEVLKLASLELKRHGRPYEILGTMTVRGTGNRLFLFFENRKVIWSRVYDIQNIMVYMPWSPGKPAVWRHNEGIEARIRELAKYRDRKTRDETVAYMVRQLSLPPE